MYAGVKGTYTIYLSDVCVPNGRGECVVCVAVSPPTLARSIRSALAYVTSRRDSCTILSNRSIQTSTNKYKECNTCETLNASNNRWQRKEL